MALIDNKVTSFTFLHTNQSDTPAIPSSAAFKAALDSQAIQLQTGLNGAIDYINTNYATKTEVTDIALGQLSDGSVTPAKLSFDPATQAELDAAVAIIQAQLVGSTMYAYRNIGGAL